MGDIITFFSFTTDISLDIRCISIRFFEREWDFSEELPAYVYFVSRSETPGDGGKGEKDFSLLREVSFYMVGNSIFFDKEIIKTALGAVGANLRYVDLL